MPPSNLEETAYVSQSDLPFEERDTLVPGGTAPAGGALVADRPPPAMAQTAEAPARRTTGRPRGFAAMDRELVTQIARRGGKAAHTAGTAHEFTVEEARIAGRKGGLATHARRAAPR